ncbi:hypothetical protein FKW77_003779 [Venturia effusa]|uniref:Uncharacterized protein n=1 Tax=Venturia effusa TaxID=50376 RepID=A0A517KZ99_9PEZI|nr:hypothetical protein FKW77_003779 [Venturia effusa]
MEGDHPDRQFSATPSHSPPNHNTAQHDNANHIPTYQGPYAYSGANLPSAPSNFMPSLRAPPTYQHGFRQLQHPGPVYSSNLHGIDLFNHDSRQMYSQASNSEGLFMTGLSTNIGRGDDNPAFETLQEPTGIRSVSEPKRVKRRSTEGEKAQRVGDRDLQTTEPRYGAYSHMFNDPRQARLLLSTRQWIPPPDQHRATPATPIEMLPYVTQVYDAMVDTSSGFYDKVNAANRILNGKYKSAELEATAWLIVDEAATLHRDGCCLPPFADPTYEVFKSACCEALDGAKTFKIVYGPTKIRDRTKNNAISNDRRAKKARISSGGSINNNGQLHEEDTGAEETLDVKVGAQEVGSLALETQSFASKGPASFVDSQLVSPTVGASPPLKIEPPQTPKKQYPPMYHSAAYGGQSAHIPTPNSLLNEYINYGPDFSNYSAGQYRPELNFSPTQAPAMPDRQHDDLVDLTGETNEPSYGENDAANAWLRRSRDSCQ